MLSAQDHRGRGRTVLRALAAGALAAVMAAGSAAAQMPPPPGGGFTNAPPRSPVCGRLEAQLAAFDRGQGDGRVEQIRRLEEAANRQQQDIERQSAQARRMGCGGSGFFLFGGGAPPQCDQINTQIQRMRSNLERIMANLRQLQGSGGDRDEQRRAILIALAQNDCGPQYRVAAPRSRGVFETLFGAPPGGQPSAGDYPDVPQPSGTYRTVCVRTCDGSFFPISYSTHQSRFAEDARTCQRMCPATEVVLYAHRNPGEDIAQAVSINGQPYTSHPNAFRFRQEYNPACGCKRANESWNEAVTNDPVERGDIVVTEDRARQMSQPKSAEPQRASSGQQPQRQRRNAPAQQQPQAQQAAQPPQQPPPPPAANPARNVGPQFYR